MYKISKSSLVILGTLSFGSLAQAAPKSVPVYLQGDASKGAQQAMMCTSCHGPDGNSSMPGTPSLAAQPARYLLKQIRDFKSGKRASPVMAGMVASLDEETMKNISLFFSNQPLQQPTNDTHSGDLQKKINRGKTLFQSGRKESSIPACNACHGMEGHGNAPSEYPAIRFQSPEYLKNMLTAFSNDTRSNDPSEMMRDIASRLEDQDVEDLIAYLNSTTD